MGKPSLTPRGGGGQQGRGGASNGAGEQPDSGDAGSSQKRDVAARVKNVSDIAKRALPNAGHLLAAIDRSRGVPAAGSPCKFSEMVFNGPGSVIIDGRGRVTTTGAVFATNVVSFEKTDEGTSLTVKNASGITRTVSWTSGNVKATLTDVTDSTIDISQTGGNVSATATDASGTTANISRTDGNVSAKFTNASKAVVNISDTKGNISAAFSGAVSDCMLNISGHHGDVSVTLKNPWTNTGKPLKVRVAAGESRSLDLPGLRIRVQD